MNTVSSQLDADELLHLAIKATERDKMDEAIGFLKQAVELAPENAKAHYLLGAVHAQIGLYDRAIEDMTRAVQLEPGLVAAHFQLGLLLITSRRVEEAKQAWEPLTSLDESNPLYWFRSGLLHLADDEFTQCIDDLSRGISLNTMNESLNNDMRKVMEAAKAAVQGKSPAATSAAENNNTKSGTGGGRHVLLSAYRNDDDTKEH